MGMGSAVTVVPIRVGRGVVQAQTSGASPGIQTSGASPGMETPTISARQGGNVAIVVRTGRVNHTEVFRIGRNTSVIVQNGGGNRSPLPQGDAFEPHDFGRETVTIRYRGPASSVFIRRSQ